MPLHKVIYIILLLILYPAYIDCQPFANDKLIDTSTIGLIYQFYASIDVDRNGNIGIASINETNYQAYLNFYISYDHGETFFKNTIDSVDVQLGSFYKANILLDYNGVIWIANYFWEGVGPISYLFIYKSIDGGATFEKKLLGYTDITDGHSLTSDSLGNLYILWKPLGDWLSSTKFVQGNLNDTIKASIPTPDFLVDAVYSNIIADKGGNNLFAVFGGGTDPDSNHYFIYKVYLVKSTDGGLSFGNPVRIDTTVTDSTDQDFPDIALWSNKISIAWRDNRSGNNVLYYTESSDNGNTFIPATEISNPESEPVNHQNYLNSNKEHLNIIWYAQNQSRDLYFSQRKGDTLLLPSEVGDPNYHNFNQLPLGVASDNQGYTYILFNDDRFGYTRLFLSSTKFTMTNIDDYSSESNFSLYQNYPNPFNSETIIKYSVPNGESSRVIIQLYNILGSEISKLVDEIKSPGEYQIQWNGTNFPSGVYFYSLQYGNVIKTKKLILLK